KNKQTPQGSARTTSAVDLEEFCKKHYEKLLPIMTDKYEYEQRMKEQLETMSPRRQRCSRSPRHNPSVFTRLRCERSRSPRHEYKSKARRESTMFKRLGSKGRSTSVHSDSRQESSRYTENHSEAKIVREGTGSLNHEERSPVSKMTISPNLRSEDPEDHLKIFQAAVKTEMWAMPTWCHMFSSTLTGNARVWFDDLPPESIDMLYNIKQRDRESTEDFIQMYKSESGNLKGAPKCMRIFRFVHGITNPELIKRFLEKIPKTVDEMMQVATSFLQGQEAASNQERKKALPAWRHQEGGHRKNFKKGEGFCSQHKQDKRPDRFTLLTKTPKEILALEKGKFKTPPPMTTPVEKRKANKFCKFHREVWHNTDECNHLRKQIEDMLKARKLSHIIRELKQSSRKYQPKKRRNLRKRETSGNSNDSVMTKGAKGPLIIEAEIGGHQVHRICIDGGSSFEILYEHCFNRLRPEIKNQMVLATTSLIGINGEIKWPLGQITLFIKIRDDEHSTSAWMHFMVVRSMSPHNGIIGRPGLRKIQAVLSTTHGMIKFPVTRGILTLKSSKIILVKCAMVSEPEEQPISGKKVREERVKVAINPEHPEQTVMIGFDLTEKTRRVPRHIAEHRLNVRKGCQLVRQKKRGQAAERNIAINDEVSKLVAGGIMREVHYHDWLSNPVMVNKSDNSWRMFVDFKDLNKACPKDGYPLPEIEWKVESLCRFPFKCFLDAYKGYHQIQMAKEDEEKTANLEVYVDDLVIKSHTEDEVVRDIEETFKTLRKINMKLNPKKCTFGVEEGMFLGYQVNTKGIKICPDKTEEAEAAFRQMEEDIAKLPMVTAPEEQEELIVYLAASKEAVSIVLMTEREARQMSIYFVSRVLRGPKVNYTPMEKLVLALVHASKRLRRYFQAHPIIVIMDQPIKNILSNPEVAGQVLADFIIERLEEEGQDNSKKEEEPLPA
ncbi:reverse transcriptase domain-containing protein, partial [Tanacetum coccineum]